VEGAAAEHLARYSSTRAHLKQLLLGRIRRAALKGWQRGLGRQRQHAPQGGQRGQRARKGGQR
jgi:hypothetical protein